MELYLTLAAIIIVILVLAVSSPNRQDYAQDSYEELLAENRDLRKELRRVRGSNNDGCLLLAILVLAGIIVLAFTSNAVALVR